MLAPDDPRHGTANGYSNLRCRCDRCREAWRTHPAQKRAELAYRRRIGIKPIAEHLAAVEPPHGTESRYNSTRWRCRCAECREAARRARAERRAKAAA